MEVSTFFQWLEMNLLLLLWWPEGVYTWENKEKDENKEPAEEK